MNVWFLQTGKQLLLVLVSTTMLVSNAQAAVHDPSRVRIWGDISTTYRARDYRGLGTDATNWLNAGTVNASSYIWRPWFATVGGALTLSMEDADYSDQGSSDSDFVTGNFSFNLFPTSRFPSQLFVSKSRDQSEDDLLERDITTTDLDLRQQYRTPDGMHRLRAEYNYNLREDPDASDTEGERVIFTSNSKLGNNVLGTDFQFDTVDDMTENEQTDSFMITGRHSYQDGIAFTVENLVSTSEVENDFVRSATNVDTAEFSSLLFWRPGSRQDLSISGNLRLSDTLLEQTDDLRTPTIDESASSNTKIANINQGLLYQFSDQILVRQSINANVTETDHGEVLVASETVGASYTADRIETGLGNYGWSFGSSYTRQHGDIDSSQTLTSRLSHSLHDTYVFMGRFPLRTALSQALGFEDKSDDFDRKSLDHSLSVTWSESRSANQSVLQFLLSDSRAEEDDEELFQLVNLQYSGRIRFDRFTSLSGDLTLQRTYREDGGQKSRSTVTNGRLEYLQNRFFDVPRLVFRSSLILGRQQSETEENIASINDRIEDDLAWENSLDWLIGRLEARFSFDLVKANGDYDRLYKIQLIRFFGDL